VNARGVLALVLQLGFLTVAFAGRTLVHRRRTGDSGFRWQRHDRTARVSGALFAAAVVVGTAGVTLAALSVTGLWDALEGTVMLVVGVAVFAAGCVLTLASQSAMGTSWRIGVDPNERTELVTDGPFGWARNPIFTGMVIAAVGLSLMAPTMLTLVALLLLVVAVEVQVRSVEETYLRTAMPDWGAYARRVGRIVPRLGRIGADG